MYAAVKKMICIGCCFILVLSRPVFAQVRLPRLVSDSMVLQRNAATKIWGWAAAGEKVSVDFRSRKYTTIAGKEGKWVIQLSPMKAGGPFNMEINASNHIMLKNILVGDVWVCSGQSNMELPMERVKYKYSEIIAHSRNPFIRQFNVATRYVFPSPQQDLVSGNWEGANPESVLHFTATGYFFAKSLYEKYHVPIGLIKSCVGGSPVEAWLSEDALKQFPPYLAAAEKYKNDNYIDSIREKDNTASRQWYNNLWLQDKGMQEEKKWYDTAYNASSWPTMPIPGYWANQGLKEVNGVVWFRKEINIPAAMTGQPAKLWLGRIVDRDSVYVNGFFAGTTGYQYPPRVYDLPAGLLKPGKNIIVVRVINSLGRGGFVEDKPYCIVAVGETIDLTGKWQYKTGAIADPLAPPTFFPYQPGGLFNGMIAPLLGYSVKGAAWYQGESNTAKPLEYRSLFSAMINDWRQKWKQGNFPFLYVQLPNYLPAKEQPSESNWALLREAQLKTLALPGTGMAVTIDIGEWNDVHPLNKEDVGRRLALAAEKIAYNNRQVVYSGPVYTSSRIKGGKIIIRFSNTGSGLAAKENGVLKGFAIAGADKKFVWANATISGNAVIISSNEVAKPLFVRYAWADNPKGANLYNKEGLPASPFRTDQ